LICGDRFWNNFQLLFDTVKKLYAVHVIECIIEGEARGADTMARLADNKLGIKVLPFPAHWDKFGKSAGPIRNRQMITEGKPTLVLAFHDDITKSRGTADMLRVAISVKIPARLFTTSGEVPADELPALLVAAAAAAHKSRPSTDIARLHKSASCQYRRAR
jgi:hypothetical protein